MSMYEDGRDVYGDDLSGAEKLLPEIKGKRGAAYRRDLLSRIRRALAAERGVRIVAEEVCR